MNLVSANLIALLLTNLYTVCTNLLIINTIFAVEKIVLIETPRFLIFRIYLITPQDYLSSMVKKTSEMVNIFGVHDMSATCSWVQM